MSYFCISYHNIKIVLDTIRVGGFMSDHTQFSNCGASNLCLSTWPVIMYFIGSVLQGCGELELTTMTQKSYHPAISTFFH